MIKEVVLDADDFIPSIYVLPHLEMLKAQIPNFKITLFTMSFDPKADEEKMKDWAKMIEEYDWIEIAQHGLDHREREFLLDYKEAKARIKEMKKINKKTGLKTEKIFRAPFWQCSDDAYKALAEAGYTVATDRNQVRPDIKGMKQYRWNWSFETEMPDYKVLKGHGHVRPPSKNNISFCLENLKKLPQDAEYLFVSEYLKKYGTD